MRRVWREALPDGAQAGGEFAIDRNQRPKLFGFWVRQERYGLVHDKQAKIGDVLPDIVWQWVVVARRRRQENRPQLAIIKERVAQELLFAFPPVLNGLET